ncbi:MAG TPA: hypothetical protein DD433_08360 [Ruminococcaceae bacterium]|nr:hypothetical protein [Oscillospiraceae bacterium]
MFSIKELDDYLKNSGAHFEIIKHDAPIISTRDAKQYFDLTFAAPALIVQSDNGLMLLIVSAKRGKLDFEEIGTKLGLSKLKLADKKKAESATGYKIGAIPLIGLKLPCIFDDLLLNFEFIYGGSGDELHTLKIDPKDVKRLNNIVFAL